MIFGYKKTIRKSWEALFLIMLKHRGASCKKGSIGRLLLLGGGYRGYRGGRGCSQGGDEQRDGSRSQSKGPWWGRSNSRFWGGFNQTDSGVNARSGMEVKDPDACYNCAKKGHFSQDCRAPRGDQNQQGCYMCEKGDISAATVLPIKTARIITVEGVGMAVFEAEVVGPWVRVEGEARAEEALVALTRQQTKGQVQHKKRIKNI